MVFFSKYLLFILSHNIFIEKRGKGTNSAHLFPFLLQWEVSHCKTPLCRVLLVAGEHLDGTWSQNGHHLHLQYSPHARTASDQPVPHTPPHSPHSWHFGRCGQDSGYTSISQISTCPPLSPPYMEKDSRRQGKERLFVCPFG